MSTVLENMANKIEQIRKEIKILEDKKTKSPLTFNSNDEVRLSLYNKALNHYISEKNKMVLRIAKCDI